MITETNPVEDFRDTIERVGHQEAVEAINKAIEDIHQARTYYSKRAYTLTIEDIAEAVYELVAELQDKLADTEAERDLVYEQNQHMTTVLRDALLWRDSDRLNEACRELSGYEPMAVTLMFAGGS